MKKRSAITIGVILFLLTVLVIKKWSCSSLPVLEGWYEPADEIIIKNNTVFLKLLKRENSWFINDEAYPGDADLIESMERKVRDFKLLDLVSENGYYNKYDLTEEKGISVTVKGKGKVLRKIIIGKAGSTNNHSYIKVDDRKEIYLASGIMQSDFTIPAADLRNKVIFNVKNSEVKSFIINYGGKNFDFYSVPLNNETDKSNENKKSVSKWKCRGYEKTNLSDSSINSILGLFSPLRAAEFPLNMDPKKAGNPLCRVMIEYGDKKAELVVYSKKDKDMNLASSTESKYVFTLGMWQLEKIFIKSINDLALKN